MNNLRKIKNNINATKYWWACALQLRVDEHTLLRFYAIRITRSTHRLLLPNIFGRTKIIPRWTKKKENKKKKKRTTKMKKKMIDVYTRTPIDRSIVYAFVVVFFLLRIYSFSANSGYVCINKIGLARSTNKKKVILPATARYTGVPR